MKKQPQYQLQELKIVKDWIESRIKPDDGGSIELYNRIKDRLDQAVGDWILENL